MKLIALTGLYGLLKAQPSPRYLFLLSHMRSYSSLLAHLLGSSPHIDGYGESHLRYRHRIDLIRLRMAIERSTEEQIRGEWLLDKVLHNYVRVPDRLLRHDQMRALIFLRSPAASLRSILSLGVRNGEVLTSRYIQSVCDYYVSRLHRLRLDGERLRHNAMYFDSEALMQRPKQVLSTIADWLQLPTPLHDRYSVMTRSGEVGFGDPSANIRSGRVLGTRASTIDRNLAIPEAILNEAQAAYMRCRESLLIACHADTTCLSRDFVFDERSSMTAWFEHIAFV